MSHDPTPEHPTGNRAGFVRACNDTWKGLHEESVRQILDTDAAARSGHSDSTGPSAKAFADYHRVIWRRVNDSIVWTVFALDRLRVKRLCLCRPRTYLAESNAAKVMEFVRQRNADPLALALWADATSCVDIGDVLVTPDVAQQRFEDFLNKELPRSYRVAGAPADRDIVRPLFQSFHQPLARPLFSRRLAPRVVRSVIRGELRARSICTLISRDLQRLLNRVECACGSNPSRNTAAGGPSRPHAASFAVPLKGSLLRVMVCQFVYSIKPCASFRSRYPTPCGLRRLGGGILVDLIKPDRPCMQLRANTLHRREILTPDRGAKSIARVIGAADDVAFILPLQHRKNRAERLFRHYARVSGGLSTSVTGMNQPLAFRSTTPPAAKRYAFLVQSWKYSSTFCTVDRSESGPSCVPPPHHHPP